jgi:hypothetical protein
MLSFNPSIHERSTASSTLLGPATTAAPPEFSIATQHTLSGQQMFDAILSLSTKEDGSYLSSLGSGEYHLHETSSSDLQNDAESAALTTSTNNAH